MHAREIFPAIFFLLILLVFYIVSEGFGNLIAKGDRPANARDVNPLETIWIIFDEKIYKDPAPESLDWLGQWLRFAWEPGSSYILYLTN